jgi:hypothetical protein
MTSPRLTIADIADLPTVTVPVAGQLLGLGRDASYGAAARGELPTLKFGHRIVVAVPALLRMLGATPENTEAGAGTPASANDDPATKRKIYRPVDNELNGSLNGIDIGV